MGYSARGVAILSVLKPTYAKFAFNLRTSLRKHNPDVPVQLFYDDAAIGHLYDWQKESFEIRTKVDPEELIFNGRPEPGRFKAFLYDRFAFDETIFIDADSLLLKPLSFDWPQDFHAIVSPSNYWLEDEAYRRHFGLNGAEIPATNTSFLFVRKGELTERLFKQWQANFDNPIKKEDVPKNGEWFNGLTPDEPYLNAALAKLGIIPDFSTPQMFCHWSESGAMPEPRDVQATAMSFWGHPGNIHFHQKQWYDRLMMSYMVEVYGTNSIYKADKLLKEKA